jgi:predicted nucleic acid-binding protein
MPLRIFLDASALFSAAYSATGAARELLRLGVEEEVRLVTNAFAVTETRRNLGSKAPHAVPLLEAILSSLPLEIRPDPDVEAVLRAAVYVELKDAPIVAGAIEAEVDYLATFDRHHLLNVATVATRSDVTIATPGDILSAIRSD